MTVDREAMKEVLNEVLDERRSIGEAAHRRDHEFIGDLVARTKRQKERMEKVKTTVLGWFVITLIIGAGSVAWQWFIHLVKATKSGG